MNEIDTKPILLGVSDAEHSEGAMLFAVEEALRHQCGITVMHVLPGSMPPPPDSPIGFGSHAERTHHFVDRSLSQEAADLVTEIARRARAMVKGKVEIETSTLIGRRVHTIVDAAENARLVVLEHRDLPVLERMFVRSTSVGVSARAHCPVVTVPPLWKSQVHHNRITVAIDDIDDAAEILRAAFESARQRSARINVVHAWKFMGSEADVIAPQELVAEWQQRSAEHLKKALEPWRQEFPDVEVDSQFVRLRAVEALLECSQDSDLLVLGRSQPSLPLPLPLGSVARAMVNGAHCPVEVVPHGAGTPAASPFGPDHEPNTPQATSQG